MTDLMATPLRGLDVPQLRTAFVAQGSFLYLPLFLRPELTAQLATAVCAVERSVNRNYLPGHKQGGTRHACLESVREAARVGRRRRNT